jgi:hypothetical protein
MALKPTAAKVPDTFLIAHQDGDEKHFVFCTTVFALDSRSLNHGHLTGIERLFGGDTFETVALDLATIEGLPVLLNRVAVSAQSSRSVGPGRLPEVIDRPSVDE